VREANNALTFQKGPGLRQKKAWAVYAARVPFEDQTQMLCYTGFLRMFLLYFLQRKAATWGMFFHDGVRRRSQFWMAPVREIGHKAGPWRNGVSTAVSRLTFAENGNP
jgi:hypothetical protein